MYNVSDKFKEHVKNNGYIEKKAKSAKEPVAKLKWSDFELEPLKPNLIKNGWDDFEAYGSGKNYVENWNFEGDMSVWNNYPHFSDLGDVAVGYRWDLRQDNLTLPEGKYVVRIKYRGEVEATGARVAFGASGRHFNINTLAKKGWHVHEEQVELKDEITDTLYLLSRENGKRIEIDWIQITSIDNQHLVVEKTPLGNGLTRIQTWGGNSRLKLIYRNTYEANVYSASFNVEPTHFMELWTSRGSESSIILKPSSAPQYVALTENNVISDMYLRVFAKSLDSNLDFIASDPQIIEGDEPNPVLIVDDLGNGKSKVRVFGANENTKLVHRGTKGIKGEPYTVKTNIDNKGNQLQLDTNLDEQNETIKKGNNDVKLEGKLKDNNIEIKLGRG